jgi:hypothetical protein
LGRTKKAQFLRPGDDESDSHSDGEEIKINRWTHSYMQRSSEIPVPMNWTLLSTGASACSIGELM